jgi:hypothetical protein
VVASTAFVDGRLPVGWRVMMSKLRSVLISAAVGAVACGILLALVMGIMAIGTSVALPGLGIIVAGPLAGGIFGALIGAVGGFVLGLLVGRVITAIRHRTIS